MRADSTQIWKLYERGVDHHNQMNLYTDTELFYNMYEGDQWNGIDSGNEKLSMHNFIQPIVEYKVAMVAMNNMTINYSPLNAGPNQQIYRQACELLNRYAASKWELKKMDAKAWEIVKQACIGGDSYLFFYNKDLDVQIIDRTNIYLSDEQEPDIQKQKYFIIYERRFVDDVKEDARKNKVSADLIAQITADEDTDNLPDAAKQEVKTDDGKCSCILYITKKNGEYYVARSTKTVVYQEDTLITGMQLGPIAKLSWSTKRGSARGIGEVQGLVNNQINANKLLARREMNNKITGYAKPVYNDQMIDNPDDIDKVGVKIRMNGMVQKVRDAFDYIAPSPMSPDAKTLQDELLNTSRDLAGAGDAATGVIDPEKASGAAIIAVRDQQAISTTQQTAAYKQLIEDVASIWLDTWIAYNPNGMEVSVEQDGQTVTQMIPAEVLRDLEVNIRIDVSPTNPFSKYARERALENALAQQHISFDEYVEALDDDGNAPKGKFKDILEKRAKMQQIMGQMQTMQGVIEKQSEALGNLMNPERMLQNPATGAQMPTAAPEGGGMNEMPAM